MTTTVNTTHTPAPTGPRRGPLITAALTVLVAAFGGYGAIYFSGVDGYTEADLTFLVVYLFMCAFGIAAAIAHAAGHRLGQPGVVVFAAWLTVFNLFKVGYVRETEAIVFLLVGLGILLLALRTRQ